MKRVKAIRYNISSFYFLSFIISIIISEIFFIIINLLRSSLADKFSNFQEILSNPAMFLLSIDFILIGLLCICWFSLTLFISLLSNKLSNGKFTASFYAIVHSLIGSAFIFIQYLLFILIRSELQLSEQFNKLVLIWILTSFSIYLNIILINEIKKEMMIKGSHDPK